jgi:hypothetical protein
MGEVGEEEDSLGIALALPPSFAATQECSEVALVGWLSLEGQTLFLEVAQAVVGALSPETVLADIVEGEVVIICATERLALKAVEPVYIVAVVGHPWYQTLRYTSAIRYVKSNQGSPEYSPSRRTLPWVLTNVMLVFYGMEVNLIINAPMGSTVPSERLSVTTFVGDALILEEQVLLLEKRMVLGTNKTFPCNFN